MIKTSDEDTSYCPQCESYAKENEKLRALLAKERDEFGKKECELKAVASAAEIVVNETIPYSTIDKRVLIEALTALREGKP